MMKKHILVITQYFYPEQFRINDICVEWVKRGYKVTVVTGIPNYPEGKYYKGYGWFKKRRSEYKGIDIIRIPLIPRGNNSLMLIFNYISFVISGWFWKMFTKIKADYVFIFEVSPMTQALPGVWYAKRNKIPCYLYVQDLWPENVEIVTGLKNKTIIGAIGKMVDYIYSNCSRIFTTSNSFIEAISNRGVSIYKLEYWPQYAEDFYLPVKKISNNEIPDDQAFNIVFTGNIGTAQGLDILPKVASIIKESIADKKVRFNIIGDGRYKGELIKLVEKNNVEELFNFMGKKSPEQIPEYIASCDAAILTLSNSPLFAMTIPAKLQSYLACGIAVIVSADGESSKIIRESQAGVSSSSGDVNDLAQNILWLSAQSPTAINEMGINAREYYDQHFNKEKLLKRMDRHFKDSVNLEVKQIV